MPHCSTRICMGAKGRGKINRPTISSVSLAMMFFLNNSMYLYAAYICISINKYRKGFHPGQGQKDRSN